MMQKMYLKLTGLIFSIVAILHLLRLIFRWDVIMGDWQIPLWVSFIGVAAAGFLAYIGFKLSK